MPNGEVPFWRARRDDNHERPLETGERMASNAAQCLEISWTEFRRTIRMAVPISEISVPSPRGFVYASYLAFVVIVVW